MFNTNFNTIRFEKKGNRTLENVTQITFSNYSKTDSAFITINGIKRELPPAFMVGFTAMPYTWSISSENPFDLSFAIHFTTAAGDVLIDYLELKKC